MTIPKALSITVPKTMTMIVTTPSDSSMFDGRERLWTGWIIGASLLYIGQGTLLRKPLTQYFCQNSLYNLYHSIHLEPTRCTFTSWERGKITESYLSPTQLSLKFSAGVKNSCRRIHQDHLTHHNHYHYHTDIWNKLDLEISIR